MIIMAQRNDFPGSALDVRVDFAVHPDYSGKFPDNLTSLEAAARAIGMKLIEVGAARFERRGNLASCHVRAWVPGGELSGFPIEDPEAPKRAQPAVIAIPDEKELRAVLHDMLHGRCSVAEQFDQHPTTDRQSAIAYAVSQQLAAPSAGGRFHLTQRGFSRMGASR